MRTLQLILAEIRLAVSPNARPVILFLLVFSLLLPIAALIAIPPQEEVMPSVNLSLVSTEVNHDMLNTIHAEFTKIDLIENVYIDDVETAKERLKRDETLLYMLFPDGFFVDSLAALKRESVRIVLNPSMPIESEFFSRMAEEITVTVIELESAYFAYADLVRPFFKDEAALQLHLDFILVGVLMRLLTRNRLVSSQKTPQFDLFGFVFASLLVVLVLFAGMLPMFFAGRDDRGGLTARFLASGFGDGRIQAARTVTGLPFVILSLLPALIVFAASFALPLTFDVLAGLFLLYLCQAFFTLTCSRLGSRNMAAPLTAFGITFIHMLASGVIYPRELLPEAVASAGSFLPAANAHRIIFDTFAAYTSKVTLLPLLIAAFLFLLILLLSKRLRGRIA